MNQLKIAVKWVVLLLVVQTVTVAVGASAANTTAHTISGRVTDSSGNPIEGILARTETVEPDYTNSLGGSAYTDENGEYAFTVENSVYYLEFVDTNRFNSFATITYFDRWYGDGQNDGGPPDGVEDREQLVVENNNLSNMDAVMTRGSTAAGTIQFENSIDVDGIDEIFVHIYHTPYAPDEWVSLNQTSDRLFMEDGDRTWRINHIPAGTYRICASYHADESVDSLFDCYGGDSLDQAADIEIGEETDLTNLTITIEPEQIPPYRITGIVSSSSGEPADDIYVRATPENDSYPANFYTNSDENGAYTLFVPAGEYKIDFGGGWHNNRHEESSLTGITVVDGDVNNVDVTLTHYPGIIGEIVAEDGRPFISGEAMLYNWVESAESPDGGYWFPVSGASGSFSTYDDDLDESPPTTRITYYMSLPYLPYTEESGQAGTYRVCAWVVYDSVTWEETRRCHGGGTTPAEGADVMVEDGQLHPNIDIAINDAPTGQFTGRITNTSGEGIGEVNISLSYNHPSFASSRYTSIKTAADGTYTADLIPGMYIVNFQDETGEYVDEKYDEQIDQTIYIDHVGEVFEPYVAYEPLIITAGETVTINETLMTAAKVTGTVTLSEPEAIIGGSARLLREEGDDYYIFSKMASIETDGTYSLDGLIGGTYRLCYYVRTVDHENLQCNGHVIPAQDSPDIILAEGERITVDFEMDLDTADRRYSPSESVPPTEPEVEPLSEEQIVGRLFLPLVTH